MKRFKLLLSIPLLFSFIGCSTNESESFLSEIDPSSSSQVIEWNEPSYIWSSDNLKLTASRTRKDNETIVETEEVATDYTVLTEPTCHDVGKGRYTSRSFINEAFNVQTKDVEIEIKNHSYGEASYDWKTDCLECNASTHCIYDGCDECVEELANTIIVEEEAATSEKDGYKTYQASFTNPLFETKERTIVQHNYVFVNYVTYAYFDTNYDTVPGEALYRCSNCNDEHLFEHYEMGGVIPL